MALVFQVVLKRVFQDRIAYRGNRIMFQKIVILGFIVGITGWCIGAFLEERTLGVSIFLVGFVVAVIGIVGSHLNMDFTSKDKLQVPGLGLKIGSIGFGVSCLSVLSGFFIDRGDIANYVFYAGFIMVVIGISIMIFGIKKHKE